MISKVAQLWTSRTKTRSHASWLFYPYSFFLALPTQPYVPFSETVHAGIEHLAWLSQNRDLISGNHDNTCFTIYFLESCIHGPRKLWDRLEGPSPSVGTDGQSGEAGLATCTPSGWVTASWMLKGGITGDGRVGGWALPVAGGTESFVPPKNWIQI